MTVRFEAQPKAARPLTGGHASHRPKLSQDFGREAHLTANLLQPYYLKLSHHTTQYPLEGGKSNICIYNYEISSHRVNAPLEM
jgi:hypothetical protein